MISRLFVILPFALCTLVGLGCAGDVEGRGEPEDDEILRTPSAGQATIAASPTVVSVATGKLGSTQITWQRSSGTAWIYVGKDGGPPALFAASPQGSASAPWIVGGHTYVFSAHPSQNPGTAPLAQVTVTTTTQAQAQNSYSEFAPYLQRYAGQIGSAGGSKAYSQWASRPLGNDRIDVSWGSPDNWSCSNGTKGCPTVEEHGIRRGCSPHGDWVWLYAYRNDWIGHRYRIRTTRALLTRNGTTSDITGQCGLDGQPYALHRVDGQAYVLKVWGDILDNNGQPGRRFYWEHRISPPGQVYNPCWKGASPVRLALRQDELWWDSILGWSIGGGKLGANKEPDGTGTWYGRYQTMARHTGFGWTLGTRGSLAASYNLSCLYSSWTW